MFFLGDYACIHTEDVEQVKEWFEKENVVVNLEGAVLDHDISRWLRRHVVFNTQDSLKFLKDINTKAVVTANNHYFDLKGQVGLSEISLAACGIKHCGAGSNIEAASRPVVLEEDGVTYVIVSFCWDITGGQMAGKKRAGVNPLTNENVKVCINEARRKYPEAYIVAFMHWGIELAKIPEPMHVQIARLSVDCGADVVIGCHPHRIQPVEKYKDKFIFYSIGNFFIESGCYFDGWLGYPECSRESLGIRIHQAKLSVVRMRKTENGKWERDEFMESEIRDLYPLCKNTSSYQEWYRKNREKRLGVPAFYDYRSRIRNRILTYYLKFRNLLIRFLVVTGLKKGRWHSG